MSWSTAVRAQQRAPFTACRGQLNAHPRRPLRVVAQAGGAPDAAMQERMQEMMKDPAMADRMKQMQEAMSRPEMQQQMAQMQAVMQNQQMQQRMQELRNDPEFKSMFEEMQKGGMPAIMK